MRGALCRVRVRLYSHNRYMEGGIEEETGRWVESVGLSARSGHVDLGGTYSWEYWFYNFLEIVNSPTSTPCLASLLSRRRVLSGTVREALPRSTTHG